MVNLLGFNCRNFIYVAVGALMLVVQACVGKSDEPAQPVDRTVLVYMIADNSLGSMGYDRLDINEMLTAVSNGALNGGRLLVYHNRRGTASGKYPVLLDVTRHGLDTLKRYPDDASIYSTDVARMREVFDDMRREAPAKDYGLVLWSHGNGWLEGSGSRSTVKRSFGEDRKVNMKVTSLAKALDGQGLGFVYFDCCLMGTVEVAYELRDVTPVIVASGTELPLNGMPYDLNVPCFFKAGEPDLTAAAMNTFNWYDVLKGDNRTCAISVLNTAGMDNLADVTRQIFTEAFTDFSVYYYGVQPYDRPLIPVCSLYDMKDYISTMLDASVDMDPARRAALMSQWNEALDGVVTYAASTPVLFGDLVMKTHCGLGSFIIMSQSEASYRGYDNQSWYKDVVSVAPALNR